MINRTTIAFWWMGILNNLGFVIMLAGAKHISEGGTALVFISNTLPGLICKLTSPYWFDRVSYFHRFKAASILFSLSFIVVGVFSRLGEGDNSNDFSFSVVMQLLGVALGSAAGSLGEASLLALGGKADSYGIGELENFSDSDDDDNNQREGGEVPEDDEGHLGEESQSTEKSLCIAAFSSGTGLAGIFGFGYIYLFTHVFHFSLSDALFIALIFPFVYWKVFKLSLLEYTINDYDNNELTALSRQQFSNNITHLDVFDEKSITADDFTDNPNTRNESQIFSIDSGSFSDDGAAVTNEDDNTPIQNMSFMERFRTVLSLWPYMIPLFVVYFSEYALQSGVWVSIGFPVDDEHQRSSFYIAGNWMYQAGVFISRSSGAFFTFPMWVLWLMPFLQVLNLVVFYIIAVHHYIYNQILFVGCFYAGLLGGAVYVHGYGRISKDIPLAKREFALASASVADSFGIIIADFCGLFIQSCLYQANNISGAVVSCPV